MAGRQFREIVAATDMPDVLARVIAGYARYTYAERLIFFFLSHSSGSVSGDLYRAVSGTLYHAIITWIPPRKIDSFDEMASTLMCWTNYRVSVVYGSWTGPFDGLVEAESIVLSGDQALKTPE